MSEVDQDPLARPAGACVLCPPPRGHAWTRADSRYATCTPCSTRMRERIAEIGERYLKLDPRPGSSVEAGSRGSPGFVSKPPASVHIIAVKDLRSSQVSRVWLAADGRVHQEETSPPRSVHGTLSTLCWAVAEHRGVSGPRDRDDVFALLRFLDPHVDFVTRHAELAVEVDEGLRALVSALRPLTGDRIRRIGKCPEMVAVEDSDEKVRCDTPLFGGWDSDVVTCRGCGHSWSMDLWLDAFDPEPAS